MLEVHTSDERTYKLLSWQKNVPRVNIKLQLSNFAIFNLRAVRSVYSVHSALKLIRAQYHFTRKQYSYTFVESGTHGTTPDERITFLYFQTRGLSQEYKLANSSFIFPLSPFPPLTLHVINTCSFIPAPFYTYVWPGWKLSNRTCFYKAKFAGLLIQTLIIQDGVEKLQTISTKV